MEELQIQVLTGEIVKALCGEECVAYQREC